jgi:hypothetical protein
MGTRADAIVHHRAVPQDLDVFRREAGRQLAFIK